MKITILGATLQAGVLAGVFSENGHQVTWCPNATSVLPIHYQDEVVNQLLNKQIQTGFLSLKPLDQLSAEQDVFLFSYRATEIEQAVKVAEKISQLLSYHPKLMINSSTFGLYGTEKLKQILTGYTWVYLPDVIQEGNAVNSFSQAKQIIVGIDSDLAADLVQELLRPIFQFKQQYLFMPILDAEFTKLSISGMLATRISYMNDLALVSEKLGIDILNVQQGLATDSRIGAAYLSAGVGFGGENFSHDILTLSSTVSGTGVNSQLLEQVWDINEQQKEILFRKLWNHYHTELNGKIVAIWGASFKENTSSIHNAPIHVMLEALWAQGVIVHLHDPQALGEIRKMYGQRDDLVLFEDQYQTVQSADALCLMTAWKQYLSPDFQRLKALMQQTFILDGRNVYNPDYVKAQGFSYAGVGRV